MNLKTLFILLLTALGGIAAGQEARTRASGVIGQRDTVEIRVFRQDDLTTSGQLSTNGSITVPLIGAVKMAGLTTDQAAAAITAKLKDGYLVNPQVSVAIQARVRRSITVLGQVQNPGLFELPADHQTTLVEAIGMAGGATRIAKTSGITLTRGGKVQTVNLKDITAGKVKDIPLRDGDLVNMPESIF